MEEARLIYSGVAHTLPAEPGQRLVIDIGGGSTELIIGEGYEPQLLESLQARLRVAERSASSPTAAVAPSASSARAWRRGPELEPMQAAFLQPRLGKRGRAAPAPCARSASACRHAIRRSPAISAEGLERAAGRLKRVGHCRELGLEAITDERRPVFPGGVAILAELFAAARHRADAHGRGRAARRPALRHGRPPNRRGPARAHRRLDAAALPRRHRAGRARRGHGAGVSRAGAPRPGSSSEPLAELVAASGPRGCTRSASTSRTAATTATAPTCCENADMPGFAREEQLLLARLVGAHRRKLAARPASRT